MINISNLILSSLAKGSSFFLIREKLSFQITECQCPLTYTDFYINILLKQRLSDELINPNMQGWGQNTLYSRTRVLEYIFSCTRDVLVLVVLVSKCTRNCTRVHSKIGCTHEYILSTI